MREDMNLHLPFDSEDPPPRQPTSPSPHAPAEASAAARVDREPEPSGSSAADTALADWKAALRLDFERWLETVEAIPAADEDQAAETETPDLYSFHEQLAALGAESRRANRKTAEVFSQWGDTLGRFDTELARLREQLDQSESVRNVGRLARGHCLMLVELLDRLRRLRAAFDAPPAKHWWKPGDEHWRKTWNAQRQALDIVVENLESLLQREGVVRIETLDQPFDPEVMVAIAAEPDPGRPHQTVIEEIGAGYLRDEELLRAAQVKVSLNRENT